MYVLWIDAEEDPPPFLATPYLHVAKTPQDAIKLVERIGSPLIVSFGRGSLKFARALKSHKLPDGFMYRVHYDKYKNRIKRIMDDRNV